MTSVPPGWDTHHPSGAVDAASACWARSIRILSAQKTTLGDVAARTFHAILSGVRRRPELSFLPLSWMRKHSVRHEIRTVHRLPMTSRHPFLIAAACALLVGCASGSDNDLALDPTPATATTVSTAKTPATTIEPIEQPTITNSDAPTSTAPEPSTTTAASSAPANESVEAQVAADFEAAMAERSRCGYDPATCDFALIAVEGSPVDQAVRATMTSRIQNNLRAVAGHGEFKVRVDDVEIDGESAIVNGCAFDSVVVFDVSNPSDPDDDIIFDDLLASTRLNWELRNTNGFWRLFANTRLERLEGGDLCGF